MGYAGYAPGMRVAEKLTEFQRALRDMPVDQAEEALDLIEKLTRNVVRTPKEEKFRRVKLSNKKITECIVEVPGAIEVLRTMGWVDEVGGEDGRCLVLPGEVRPTFEQEVVEIIDTRQYYKKERETAKSRQRREERTAGDADARTMKEKFDIDRLERAAEGPARASHAKKLGDGPNVMRASDLGIGKSQGG